MDIYQCEHALFLVVIMKYIEVIKDVEAAPYFTK